MISLYVRCLNSGIFLRTSTLGQIAGARRVLGGASPASTRTTTAVMLSWPPPALASATSVFGASAMSSAVMISGTSESLR